MILTIKSFERFDNREISAPKLGQISKIDVYVLLMLAGYTDILEM
jgi:hypothetical protein